MAEILIKAIDHIHPDSVKDRRGAYKRGMPVVVMQDGHEWGLEERLPKFIVLKIPGVAVDTVEKYIVQQLDDTPDEKGVYPVYRRRLWQIQWNDLPAGAKAKLLADGELTIKVGDYAGEFDYTWSQIKTYFKNLKTGLAETADL
jgi:hypothetical protein